MAPPQRTPPIHIPALSPPSDVLRKAGIIFIHGLGDEAAGCENIAHQFQAAKKLPHTQWIFPNALEHHDAMTTAWYTPTPLSPFPSQRPELDDPEDLPGLQSSATYIESLIDELVADGVDVSRVVLMGFSQGCALSLFMSLTSKKYAGKLGGVVGLCGYLPVAEQIAELRRDAELPDRVSTGDEHNKAGTRYFLARGTKDMLVPKRYFGIMERGLMGAGENRGLDLPEDYLEMKEYEGMGHAMTGAVFRDVCGWLEGLLGEGQ